MSSETPSTSSKPTATFIKKKTRPANVRKRDTSPTLSSDPSLPVISSSSAVVRPISKTSANPLIQGTKRTYSQRENDDNDDRGPDVKWKASGNIKELMDAEKERISKEEEQEILKKYKRDAENEEREDDGLYHGSAAYKSHMRKREDGGVPKAMRVGPQKSTSTIRTVTVVDYQPDVCKDYKETGYCGFGDTCKFLHDRGNYLQGWQLDKLAADPKKNAQKEESDSDDEDIPFACYICRKPYTNPIVTRCTHYFCSACAIKRFAKTPKCAACGAPTGGIFNRADKVIAKMREKEKAKKKRDGIEGNDDDDGSDSASASGLNVEFGNL
ncbi:uncharacterized protein EI90DRAFT_3070079 [Cantharellus anzutake]|uniref:uncharacterized protein n=1 Tax=Cantharellus anzutake TaxID=1750568 RepID=UPI001906D04C|nr:uncharacterized protein EI90DRAFT_3070079 [Cantharellus anzutake]KAF8326657.1 hypothetical protein EI90DRAFT_3070079 [Cantharellus anzutake]